MTATSARIEVPAAARLGLLAMPSQHAPLDATIPEINSKGSELHARGECRPCAFFWKNEGCENRQDCVFCHLCPPGEKKKRKQKKERQREKEETNFNGCETSQEAPACSDLSTCPELSVLEPDMAKLSATFEEFGGSPSLAGELSKPVGESQLCTPWEKPQLSKASWDLEAPPGLPKTPPPAFKLPAAFVRSTEMESVQQMAEELLQVGLQMQMASEDWTAWGADPFWQPAWGWPNHEWPVQEEWQLQEWQDWPAWTQWPTSSLPAWRAEAQPQPERVQLELDRLLTERMPATPAPAITAPTPDMPQLPPAPDSYPGLLKEFLPERPLQPPPGLEDIFDPSDPLVIVEREHGTPDSGNSLVVRCREKSPSSSVETSDTPRLIPSWEFATRSLSPLDVQGLSSFDDKVVASKDTSEQASDQAWESLFQSNPGMLLAGVSDGC
mmetsp:Transcript_59882/g.106494  ORF Transcript_59882/g.106494 Transcript_59882/m.106494 type:complete len:441 (-) Transcript_59882:125-1447(-)|eukprot:CAMPEP_0197642808 /NCGR_PEP_ID=MMETSP1338-20131121/16354_1 /TAXON_ID=43686 ORGANISM="Pelagodinium beii, Strain RCC1491" /NCGR_SAMPLE_ID=MMETSP1338 /ASSEMBLY_ACC=CAM_ASM_000754 /LENGTH=440 /DNA_ID=CAMNT_0043215985 /DNA_START=49 /DNA_END=1371 /DNA_ORIENTATION=-